MKKNIRTLNLFNLIFNISLKYLIIYILEQIKKNID
jgi:hypothetical protein